MENLVWAAVAASVLAGGGALALLLRVAHYQKGSEPARALAAELRAAVLSYWRHMSILCGGALVAALAVLAALLSAGAVTDLMLPLAFLSGGVFAALAAFGASYAAVGAAPRAAAGARKRLEKGYRSAFYASGGAALGVMALALGHAGLWMLLVRLYRGDDIAAMCRTAVLFSLGATVTTALTGAGCVFHRAAVGASLQVRQSIELPRDPACAAMQAGHAVGSAGVMASGMFDAFSIALLCAFSLGAAAGQSSYTVWGHALLPAVVASAALIFSTVAALMMKPGEQDGGAALLRLPRLGLSLTALLTGAVSLPAVYLLTGSWALCLPILSGLLVGWAVALCCDLALSERAQAVRELAETADRGAAHSMLYAAALSFGRAAAPLALVVLLCALAPLMAPGADSAYTLALAVTAMLSLSASVLAGALTAPITDSASAIAALTARSQDAEEHCGALAAACAQSGYAGRGFLALTGALPAALLLLSCRDVLGQRAPLFPFLSELPGLTGALGALAGGLLVPGAAALLLDGVRRATQLTAQESLRQSREIKGLAEGEGQPDYHRCVVLCAAPAQLWTLLAAAAAVAAPAAVWLLLGDGALMWSCAAAAVTALSASLLFTYAHSLLDAARRYLERGRHGGVGSVWHSSISAVSLLSAPLGEVAAPMLTVLLRVYVSVAVLLWLLPAP